MLGTAYGARTKSVLNLLDKAGASLACTEDRLAEVISTVVPGSFRVADGELQVCVDSTWARVGFFVGFELHLDPDPAVVVKPAEPEWHQPDGMTRVHANTGEVQRWTGSKWSPDGSYQRMSNGSGEVVEKQSRMSDLSPLGTHREATSQYVDGDQTIYTVENGALGVGVVEVLQTPSGRDIWLDEQTLERIESNPKLDEQFTEDVRRWDPGMKYLMEDVSYTSFFKDAVTREQMEKRNRKADVIEVDPVDRLKRDADSLLIQAAEFNATPSAVVMESFGSRLGELQSEVAELERRLAQVKDTLGLAGTAIVEAAS